MLKTLIEKFFGTEKSGCTAKRRLQVVIMQDRTTFTPIVMDKLRQDLLEVFSKYLEIEEEGMSFNVEKEEENVGLSISIPIKRVKNEPEKEVKKEENEE